MLIHPTRNSLTFYKLLIEESERLTKIPGAQDLFNLMTRKIRRRVTIKRRLLDYQKFPEGQTYFEAEKRRLYSSDPCPSCFICHNNFIVGTEAKRYRFRE